MTCFSAVYQCNESLWRSSITVMGASWLSICSKNIKQHNWTETCILLIAAAVTHGWIFFFALNSWVKSHPWGSLLPHNRIHVYYIRTECTSSLFFRKLQVYKKGGEGQNWCMFPARKTGKDDQQSVFAHLYWKLYNRWWDSTDCLLCWSETFILGKPFPGGALQVMLSSFCIRWWWEHMVVNTDITGIKKMFFILAATGAAKGILLSNGLFIHPSLSDATVHL